MTKKKLYEPLHLEWCRNGTWFGKTLTEEYDLYSSYANQLAETVDRYYYPFAPDKRVRVSYYEPEKLS